MCPETMKIHGVTSPSFNYQSDRSLWLSVSHTDHKRGWKTQGCSSCGLCEFCFLVRVHFKRCNIHSSSSSSHGCTVLFQKPDGVCASKKGRHGLDKGLCHKIQTLETCARALCVWQHSEHQSPRRWVTAHGSLFLRALS